MVRGEVVRFKVVRVKRLGLGLGLGLGLEVVRNAFIVHLYETICSGHRISGKNQDPAVLAQRSCHNSCHKFLLELRLLELRD